VTLNARQYERATGGDLRQVTPGFYVDEIGMEYFYLPGLYPRLANRLLENPLLDTPAFVSELLCELRGRLENWFCVELMD
jgi:hypothetical protein